ERYNLAMGATSDGLWDWEISTGKTYFSPQYFQMLGYASEEMQHQLQSWEELVHPEDRERVLREEHERLAGPDGAFSVEFRMRAADGSYRWILSRGKAVSRDANGNANRVVGTHTDITALKEAVAS